jgi:hypothetical protein
LVPSAHGFSRFSGIDNALTVGVGAEAVTFSGPGAGPDVTAASVLDDIVEVVEGHRRARVGPAGHGRRDVLRTPPTGRWFITVDWGPDARESASAAELAQFLASHALPAVAIVGERRRFAAVTADAPVEIVRDVTDALAASGAQTTWCPVLDEVARV